MASLYEHYKKEIIPSLVDTFQYKNSMQVPRIEKVVLNIGVGESIQNPKALDGAINDLQIISGQKPVVTRAKKSIAGFKLREGMAIGCKVTMRGARMFDFLEKLINLALPRVRDFRGVSSQAFDGRGNYSLGIKEQTIFPEIAYDKIDKIRGLEVIINTTAKTDEEAREMLKRMGMPFR